MLHVHMSDMLHSVSGKNRWSLVRTPFPLGPLPDRDPKLSNGPGEAGREKYVVSTAKHREARPAARKSIHWKLGLSTDHVQVNSLPSHAHCHRLGHQQRTLHRKKTSFIEDEASEKFGLLFYQLHHYYTMRNRDVPQQRRSSSRRGR